jgi:hypothetical protein
MPGIDFTYRLSNRGYKKKDGLLVTWQVHMWSLQKNGELQSLLEYKFKQLFEPAEM